MIQAITGTNLTVYLQTEDNRIDTSVAKTQIRHLFKFTNDMDKSIVYAYGVYLKILKTDILSSLLLIMQRLTFTQG
jgi:hypothetical protein